MPRDREDYTKPANTFIGKGIRVQAQKLSGEESVRIDGHFIGDIELDGYLQLGETGQIDGNVQVSYALIAGKVTGNINCRATMHLAASSSVAGDLTAGRIVVDEGASILGHIKTKDSTSEAK